jgi:hypothetical protein
MTEELQITFDDWRPVRGRMEPHAVRIEGRITVDAIKRAPLGQCLNDQRRDHNRPTEDPPTTAVGRPRTRKLSVAELVETADIYRLAQMWGVSPTKNVAMHQHISWSAAAKRVMKARELGLLPATGKGQARA